MTPLIDAAELADLIDSDTPPRLLDVRWRLDQPDGREDFISGHIPGAVYVDFDAELSRSGAPEDGRHPLPSVQVLQDAARRWGLDVGDVVVAYDDVGSIAAARAWFMLTRAGVADVRVLDGGLSSWRDAGRPLESGEVLPSRGDVTLTEAASGVIGMAEAADWPADGVLLDVRAAERYRGEQEPLDPIAGHIPGAISLPTTLHAVGGRFLDPETLRRTFAGAGVNTQTRVAAYCGSGVNAAHTALAGALAGIDITLYAGSWSQWSNTPGAPIATGPTPGGGDRANG